MKIIFINSISQPQIYNKKFINLILVKLFSSLLNAIFLLFEGINLLFYDLDKNGNKT